MYYKIVRDDTREILIYSETYDSVAWVEQDRTHKHFEESFWFTFEQLEELISGLLRNDEVEIYCIEE